MTTSKKDIWLGFIMSIISAILFSTKAVIVKMIYLTQTTDISAIKILTLRYLLSLPLIFLIQIIIHSNNKLKKEEFSFSQILIFCIIGLIGYGASSWFDFKGLEYVSANIERVLLFSYPALVIVLSVLVFKTTINRYQILALLLTFIGIFIAFKSEMNFSTANENFTLGVYLICASSFFYAVYLLLSPKYIKKLGAIPHANFTIILNTIVLSIIYSIWIGDDLFYIPQNLWAYFILLGLFSTIIPIYLVNLSIAKIGASNVALISTLGPVSTIFQAHIFLDEPITKFQIIGTIFVIIGVWLTTYKLDKDKDLV